MIRPHIRLLATVLLASATLPLLAPVNAFAKPSEIAHGAKVVPFDRQFIDMMVPHHQGAVAMAQIALKRGQHGQIKRLARAIIASQNNEITRMKSWRKAWYGSAQTPSTQQMPVLPGSRMHMMDISADIRRLRTAKPFDKAFIDAMTPHHQSAVEAGRLELSRGSRAQLKRLAGGIIAAQQREIKEMRSWRATWYGHSGMSGM